PGLNHKLRGWVTTQARHVLGMKSVTIPGRSLVRMTSTGPSLSWFDTWGAWFRTPAGSASSTGLGPDRDGSPAPARALGPAVGIGPSCPAGPAPPLNVGTPDSPAQSTGTSPTSPVAGGHR